MNLNERERVKDSIKKRLSLNRIIGQSQVVSKLRQQIGNISNCDVSVLITGESGTGKELAARALHYLSKRADKPFVPVNCGAIPENLFENELFGHRKGAFTDASCHQEGLVNEAQGGTLFLDEVGVIPPHVQVKLLRLLQEKEYKRLGDPTVRKADIRIIAATNENLPQSVEKGSFREDFYYRLNIISLFISPLRERTDDIPILTQHFIKKYSHEYNKNIDGISSQAMKILLENSWPGNIRQLENKIQQAIVVCDTNRIQARDLEFFRDKLMHKNLSAVGEKNLTKETFSQAKKRIVNTFEKEYLTKLLNEFKGDMVRAAEKAGKSRTALWNLVSKHQLHPRQFT